MPITLIMGPRQSGKTTLAKTLLPDWQYVSLEDRDNRQMAIEDPRYFLKQYPGRSIIDEAQKAPDLFSYLQTWTDENGSCPGQYLLTGSHNYLMMEQVSQSLAGRVSIYELLPLSLKELAKGHGPLQDCWSLIYSGAYPRVITQDLEPNHYYSDYIQTYVERDVRQLKLIKDFYLFERFLQLCAGRVGQLLNINELARDCGIDHRTAESWLSLLETSFVTFRLQPYYRNFSKRVVKMPKLYFYDTGVACALLKLDSLNQLHNYHAKGLLFENFIVSELMKQRFNQGKNSNLYFWRNKTGHEIDIIVDNRNALIPIEIKSGMTVNSDYFKNLQYWNKVSNTPAENNVVIYAGDQDQFRSNGKVISWRNIEREES